jgi:hypothetical protein
LSNGYRQRPHRLRSHEIRQAISDEELIGRKKGTRVVFLQDDLKSWLKSLPTVTGKKLVSAK